MPLFYTQFYCVRVTHLTLCFALASYALRPHTVPCAREPCLAPASRTLRPRAVPCAREPCLETARCALRPRAVPCAREPCLAIACSVFRPYVALCSRMRRSLFLVVVVWTDVDVVASKTLCVNVKAHYLTQERAALACFA